VLLSRFCKLGLPTSSRPWLGLPLQSLKRGRMGIPGGGPLPPFPWRTCHPRTHRGGAAWWGASRRSFSPPIGPPPAARDGWRPHSATGDGGGDQGLTVLEVMAEEEGKVLAQCVMSRSCGAGGPTLARPRAANWLPCSSLCRGHRREQREEVDGPPVCERKRRGEG
jgi:hypothetical protein